MSDAPDPQEGWQAPRRLPLLAAAAILAVLTMGLLLGGHVYRQRILPRTRPPALLAPEPRLETFQNPPGERRRWQPRPPAGIDAAIAASAREGDGLWQARGR